MKKISEIAIEINSKVQRRKKVWMTSLDKT